MSGLQLRVLGDLEVIRDGVVQSLPPSRKTRGLLAYLALTERPQRREQLCELLWEIPDDPRGSLRWSLSKIRKLVDDGDHPRIIADRNTVSFDTSTVAIDVLGLHQGARVVEETSLDDLLLLAEQSQGVFLEGLDLTDFNDFHTWCIGERERAIRSRARVLDELRKRLTGQPERALEHALSLVALTPFDEGARAELIRLLVRLDRQQEAEHQYRTGLAKLAEVGVETSGALAVALHRHTPAPAGDEIPTSTRVSGEVDLVGRCEEYQHLESRIRQLGEQRHVGAILIRGEPGIGKSRLLQAAAAMARKAGAGLLKASAFESEAIRPFGVWNDALKRALPDNDTSRLLSSGEDVNRDQIFDSLVDVLTSETAKRPVVVLCDDVHWSDESSLSAMHYVLRNQPHQPLLVIATSREVELRDNAPAQQVLRSLRSDGLIDEIQLQPLEPAYIQQLIDINYPQADSAALSRDCGGNPLLALELARAGSEGGSSLAELVSERMSGFDSEEVTTLQWAAVLSPRINLPSLERVCGLSRELIDNALEQAEQQGILHPGERGLRFAHELIRHSVYQTISPSRCQAMHRKVAELLEKDASVDLDLAVDLSHHARLSGDPHLAARAMVSAGRLCLRFYANEDALALYREGMEFTAQLGDAQRVYLALELGEIRMNAEPVEDWKARADEFVSLAEQAMDHGSRPHARLGYQMASYLRWVHGELQGARRFSKQAERVSRGASGEAQVLGMAESAKCLVLLEKDLSLAEAMSLEANALAQRAGIECPAIPSTLGMLAYYGGRFDESLEHLEDARTLAKSSGDRLTEYMANEYLTMLEMERGDYAAALDRVDVMVDIGTRIREGSEKPFAESLQAVCLCQLEGNDRALEAALEQLRLADAKQRLSFVLNRAAIVYIGQDRWEKGLACASEALELARIMERPTEILQALTSLEQVHREKPALVPGSQREQMRELVASAVAPWARERCEAMLPES